jgi:hypothetical protein
MRIQWVECVGKQFGYLTVTGNSYMRGKYRYVECVCLCGNKREIDSRNMRLGLVRSCGCLVNPGPYRHGRHDTPEYRVWNTMRFRCGNPACKDYEDYGGRGIKVAPEWSSFEAFYADMGSRPSPQHTLERVDNDKGYSRNNCVWATTKQQARNKRNQVRYEHNGESLLLSEWADRLNCDTRLIWHRIYRLNWTVAKAVTEPVKSNSKRSLQKPLDMLKPLA